MKVKILILIFFKNDKCQLICNENSFKGKGRNIPPKIQNFHIKKLDFIFLGGI
jgi:hypothetical protein